jgi:hypothetical protein
LITICEQHFRRNEFVFMSALVALVVKIPTSSTAGQKSTDGESHSTGHAADIDEFTSVSKLFGPDEFFEPFIYLPNWSGLVDRAKLVVDADPGGSDSKGN